MGQDGGIWSWVNLLALNFQNLMQLFQEKIRTFEQMFKLFKSDKANPTFRIFKISP